MHSIATNKLRVREARKTGVIQKVESSKWATPIVYVKKKNNKISVH